MKKNLKVGDRVRLTGDFLRSTGQYTGDEPFKRWTVVAVDGRFVVVDEPKDDAAAYFTEAELAADPSLRLRRVALCNLERVRS